MKEYIKLFIAANTLVFSLVFCVKFVNYLDQKAEPLFYIRTIDGDYYSKEFKHYGSHVTFTHDGETFKKSQKGLKGTVVERIR